MRRWAVFLPMLLAGCAGAPPQPYPRPRVEAKAEAIRRADVATCYNLEYGFTCVPPRGFLITSEGPGPGEIMTLVKRSQTTAEEANLTVQAYALRNDKLKWLVEERVLSPIKDLTGVQNLEMKPAKMAMRDGFEVSYDRRYASGAFRARAFCFERGKDAFIVQLVSPMDRAQEGTDPLESFVGSLSFR